MRDASGQVRLPRESARREGFHSISVDLMYGLPWQSVARFGHTVDEIIAQNPDRISVFNYAHLPDLFKTQRQIDPSALPSPASSCVRPSRM